MSVSIHMRVWQCVGAVSISQQLICTEWVCVCFISIDRQAGEVNRPSRTQWRPETLKVIEKRSPARCFFLVKMIKLNSCCWKENYELRQTNHKVTRTILSRNPALIPLLTTSPWISYFNVNVNRDVGRSITDEDKGVKLPWAADWKREACQRDGMLQAEQKSIRTTDIALGGGRAHKGKNRETWSQTIHYIWLQVWVFVCVCRRRLHLHTMCQPTHETLLGEADWPHQQDMAEQDDARCCWTESHQHPAERQQGPESLWL